MSTLGSVADISKSNKEWLGKMATPVARTPPTEDHTIKRSPEASIRQSLVPTPMQSRAASISRSDSGEDPDAPFPTPLHIIQVLTLAGNRCHPKPKRSTRTWELSDLGGETSHNDSRVEKKGSAEGASTALNNPGFEGSSLADLAISLREWCALLPNATVPGDLEARALNEIPSNAEFHPVTGVLSTQVDYPDTHINLLPGPCRDADDISWRQANMTSELQIVREMKTRERITATLRLKLKQHRELSTPPPEEESWPKAECVLRPAVPADLPKILEIIKLEMESECPSIIEADADLESVERIWKYCWDNFRPCIVASPSSGPDMLDRSKWPKDAEAQYQAFAKFQEKQKADEVPPIVGFAFVTEARLGMSGNHCVGSRFSAAIKVLVHPNHRRKSYGTALLDRILQCVVSYSHSRVDYKWECPETRGIYENPTIRNRRKYARVYVDIVVEGEEDPNLPWITRMMEKFEFKRAGYLKQTMRTARGPNSKWLDVIVWELEARPSHDIKA